MPNTCQTEKQMQGNGSSQSQQAPQPTKISNFIEILFDTINGDKLKQLLHFSCGNLKTKYFDDVHCESLHIIKNLIETAPHTVLLCCFFILLNIDEDLKLYIYKCDEKNADKLSTFLISLRFKIISDFSMDESISTNELVSTCFETYIIS